jgi:hypothetical protein
LWVCGEVWATENAQVEQEIQAAHVVFQCDDGSYVRNMVRLGALGV